MPASAEQSQLRAKTKRFWALCISLALLMAGCSVGPNYRRPPSPVPSAWSSLGAATSSEPSELVTWWKTFNDPMLTSLVERAIQSNLDLRQAEARIRQARAARGVVASGLWPEIDASASYRRSRGSTSSSGSSGSGSGSPGQANPQSAPSRSGGDTRNLFQIGLDAAWELDIFGGVRRNIEASTADIEAAVEDRRDVMVSLVAEVGSNYLNLRGFQQQIAIARNNLDAQIHTADITRKRFEAGFVSRLDVANANTQVANTESQIPLLESAAQGTIYSLSILLGKEPAALLQELAESKPIPITPPEIPVGLPSDLLRRRPDIRKTEAQLHAATARIGVATADLFPKFSLTGSTGFLGADINTLANWSSRFWSYGPSVIWPIFDAGRIRSNIKVQDALQEQSLATYEKTILTALKDVETALVAYAKEREHYNALLTALENSRKAVDLSMKLYVAGKIDFLNVLLAQRTLFTSEDALAQSSRTLGSNLIALYKALGGGWEQRP